MDEAFPLPTLAGLAGVVVGVAVLVQDAVAVLLLEGVVLAVVLRVAAGVLVGLGHLANEDGLSGGGSEREPGVRRRQRQHAGPQAGVALPGMPLLLAIARDHHRRVQGRSLRLVLIAN